MRKQGKVTLLRSNKDGEILVEVDKRWLGIKDGREVYGYSPDTWESLTVDFDEIKTLKLKIAELRGDIKEYKQILKDDKKTIRATGY